MSGPVFVDAFAGCGGLSLGLKRAGWRGLFAIEKDSFAFDTLMANFWPGGRYDYAWPTSIERKPWDIDELLKTRSEELAAFNGQIDLLAGGPPCQGFSHAGRRRIDDPRNQLFEAYLQLVRVFRPKLVLVENVKGFLTDFEEQRSNGIGNFASELSNRLSPDYTIVSSIVKAIEFGVPQSRPRFFLVGVRRDFGPVSTLASFFTGLRDRSHAVLSAHGLPRSPTVRDAISDLEVSLNGTMPCPDSAGFESIAYRAPRSSYQLAMRDGHVGAPSDTRLARHRPEIRERFAAIMRTCREDGRLNIAVSSEMRELYGLKKVALRVLDPLGPAPTITSMPDDLLHYSEPRTLTVRENARLQTFPDWFEFRGKYTTGGHLRRREVPRFTQVANAVPPLLAEQIGLGLLDLLPLVMSCDMVR